MDEAPKVFAPELSPAASRRWMGRLVIAVLLGAALWNFVASLTVNVVVPGLARVMEADAQSPFYLGKGDINVAAFFISLLELCFAMIAVLAVSTLSDRRPKPVRRRSASLAPSLVSAPIIPPAATIPAQPYPRAEPPREPKPVPTPAPVAPRPVTQTQPAAPQTQVAPAPPAKPPKAKKVYYNSVGDPIEVDDE
jgi:hypothetical protein